MGTQIRGIPEDSALTPAVDGGGGGDASIGRYLARQRRLRGVSLDDLAGLTQIPRRSLERLEDGAFDDQTDGFSRGFVRTVADALGLDSEEAVLRLMGEPEVGEEELADRRLSLRRWAVGSVLLLGGMAILSGLWSLRQGGRLDPAAVDDEIVYPRDAVRELAEMQRGAADTADGSSIAD